MPVMVESCRNPCGFIMTGFTTGRELGSYMIRVGSLVIIILMASIAKIRRVNIIAFMAGKAIGGNGGMST